MEDIQQVIKEFTARRAFQSRQVEEKEKGTGGEAGEQNPLF